MSANTSTPTGSQCVDCDICGKTVSRYGGMARHMKIHSKDKGKMLHRCPWPGCTFANLQKSNLDTHLNTHTNTKNQICPNCDFKSVDPGSLTRHRKRFHGYVPKPRKARGVASEPQPSTSAATSTPTKPPKRRTPYTRPALPKTSVSDGIFRESVYTSMARSTKVGQDDLNPDDSYFWRSGEEQLVRSPSPKTLYPAVDTGRHMEDGLSAEGFVYNQPAPMSFDQVDDWNLAAPPVMPNNQRSMDQTLMVAGMPQEQWNTTPTPFDLQLGSLHLYQQPQLGLIPTEVTIPYDWSAMQLPPFEQQASLSPESQLSQAPWTPSDCTDSSYASTTRGYFQGALEYLELFMGPASPQNGFVVPQASQPAPVSLLPSYYMSNWQQ